MKLIKDKDIKSKDTINLEMIKHIEEIGQQSNQRKHEKTKQYVKIKKTNQLISTNQQERREAELVSYMKRSGKEIRRTINPSQTREMNNRHNILIEKCI